MHAPWALAIAARLRERYADMDVQALHTDDGIVLRVPDTDEPPAGIAEFEPDELEPLITARAGRLGAVRVPVPPRMRRPGAAAAAPPAQAGAPRSGSSGSGPRTCWPWRPRVRHLPIVLETVRECVQDVFDVPALTGLMRDLAGRKVRLVEVETPAPSPFGRSLLFRYVGAFMYEGDSPLAEQRAQALALDSSLLAELLGQADLRELLDPEVAEQTQNELQRLAPGRACRDLEAVADLLRTIGPLSAAEVAERCAEPGAAPGWLSELAAQRRAIEVRISGEARWAAIENAGRLRDALGVPLPVSMPATFTGRCRTRWKTWWPGTRAATARSPPPTWPAGTASGRRLSPARCGGWRRRAGSARASPGPAGGAPNGATPRCCGCCGAAAWPGSARRPSPSRGGAWRVPARLAETQVGGPGVPARDGRDPAGAGGRPGRTRYTTRSSSSPGRLPASALETLTLPGRVPGYQGGCWTS